jgi:hypothetical protein
MSTRRKTNAATENVADSAVRDTAEYMAKSLGVFLLSASSLILTALAWVSVGLSLATGKLAEGSFAGAKKLRVAAGRVKWREKKE